MVAHSQNCPGMWGLGRELRFCYPNIGKSLLEAWSLELSMLQRDWDQPRQQPRWRRET